MLGENDFGLTPSSAKFGFLADYRDQYRRADQFCQEVQNFIDEAGIPAINELRNAGHHLIKALDDSGQLVKEGELTRAINHAKRACYEAGEAGALVALDGIRAFKEQYRMIQVSKVIKDYATLLGEAEQKREEMTQGRAEHEDKAEDYQLRMDAFRRLREILRVLEGGREDCNALAGEDRRAARRFFITASIMVLGIIVAAGVAIYNANAKIPETPDAMATHATEPASDAS